MASDIEDRYGCIVSDWSMSLVHFDRFVDGKLVSVPCSESMGEYFRDQLMDDHVHNDSNSIADATFTMEGDQGWLGLVVEDEEDVSTAAHALSSTVDRPVDWRGN